MKNNGLTVVEKETQKVREAKAGIQKTLHLLKMRYTCFLCGLNIFEPVAVKENIVPSTDGKHLFFNAEQVLCNCKSYGSKWLLRVIMHMLLHGMFGDFEVETEEKWQKLRGAVMDFKVDKLLTLLGYSGNKSCLREDYNVDDFGMEYYSGMYSRGRHNKRYANKVLGAAETVRSDDHMYWMRVIKENDEEESEEEQETQELWRQARRMMFSCGGEKKSEGITIEEMFRAMTNHGYHLNYGAKNWLERAMGGKSQGYRQLLRKLILRQETAREEDTIDPALYLYGLDCYGDVPLIEPLELSEKRTLDTLVVAVDTSGSCEDMVPKFLRETAEIFREVGELANGGEVYYLECDVKITQEQLFEDYVRAADAFQIHEVTGGGGTNFRPVFQRIEKLKKKGKRINGLIYLSDAAGRFPDEEPDYPVYFVLDKDWYERYEPQVPSWVNMVWL